MTSILKLGFCKKTISIKSNRLYINKIAKYFLIVESDKFLWSTDSGDFKYKASPKISCPIPLSDRLSHLAKLITTGDLSIEQVISKHRLDYVMDAIKNSKAEKLNDIKSKVKEDITYDEIKLVLAHFKNLQ